MDSLRTRRHSGRLARLSGDILLSGGGPSFRNAVPGWELLYAAADESVGEVAAGKVADPARRDQIEVDVVVFAPDDPGRPRRVLSIGEAKWDKIMTVRNLDRLRRARDLLAVKGYEMGSARLTCYSGAGFDAALRETANTDPLCGWWG